MYVFLALQTSRCDQSVWAYPY